MSLIAYLNEHYAPASAACYNRDIQAFLISYPGAVNASHRQLLGCIGELRKRYSNGHTLKRILASIKVYYDYLCYSGKRPDHPARSIYLQDGKTDDVQLQDLFTRQELERLLQISTRYKALKARNLILIGLLVYQGLKAQELALLRDTDIYLDKGRVYVQGTATTNSRELPLKANQILLLQTYLDKDRPSLLGKNSSDKLLVGIRGQPMQTEDIVKHVLRTYKGRYGDRAVTTQTIRQSVIANLLKEGHDISVVQYYAGHKYPSSTERYKQQDFSVLKQVVNKYHPMR
jgi:integrase/recombinase XerD